MSLSLLLTLEILSAYRPGLLYLGTIGTSQRAYAKVRGPTNLERTKFATSKPRTKPFN